jgi:hypothetical protein
MWITSGFAPILAHFHRKWLRNTLLTKLKWVFNQSQRRVIFQKGQADEKQIERGGTNLGERVRGAARRD